VQYAAPLERISAVVEQVSEQARLPKILYGRHCRQRAVRLTAPERRSTKPRQNPPDISRADFMWCLMAAQRGHGVEEIAARMMELSTKAAENGQNYTTRTAENATSTASRGTQKRQL
jgi:hypothetical protein